MFQSTFPQGERHISEVVQTSASQVSIHVPTRGTTSFLPNQENLVLFQSTFPQGERPTADILFTAVHIVSIHVPTRGTTSRFDSGCSAFTEFQSTFPQGERLRCTSIRRIFRSFNPRSHKGNDKPGFIKTAVQKGFNPRSHKGNDAAPAFRRR